MPDNAVFISYAREDLAAVQQLKAGLEAAGVTTWFDMERLESGDDYDLKIQRNIARCSYFIPVVSAATQRRHEAYFRRELELRARPCAQHGRWRPVRAAGGRSMRPPLPRRWYRTDSRRCTSLQLQGGAVTPNFAERLVDFTRARKP